MDQKVGGVVGIGYLRPDQFLDYLTVIQILIFARRNEITFLLHFHVSSVLNIIGIKGAPKGRLTMTTMTTRIA